ncbi:YqcI/YcgG family protein [Mariniflexile fucanivorans]|uniref:YqcI/YcgG family protein n=1 Tax=Mariniflexile fucanivorans TaxID=264023 RepID=A0A4R1RNR2_9FLAO|nr:YqcI/YcgG family protein [Mariniflexile fucanivorans]
MKPNISQKYKNFILKKKHPCVMANSIFRLNNYELKIYDDITCDEIIKPILSDIENFNKS